MTDPKSEIVGLAEGDIPMSLRTSERVALAIILIDVTTIALNTNNPPPLMGLCKFAVVFALALWIIAAPWFGSQRSQGVSSNV